VNSPLPLLVCCAVAALLKVTFNSQTLPLPHREALEFHTVATTSQVAEPGHSPVPYLCCALLVLCPACAVPSLCCSVLVLCPPCAVLGRSRPAEVPAVCRSHRGGAQVVERHGAAQLLRLGRRLLRHRRPRRGHVSSCPCRPFQSACGTSLQRGTMPVAPPACLDQAKRGTTHKPGEQGAVRAITPVSSSCCLSDTESHPPLLCFTALFREALQAWPLLAAPASEIHPSTLSFPLMCVCRASESSSNGASQAQWPPPSAPSGPWATWICTATTCKAASHLLWPPFPLSPACECTAHHTCALTPAVIDSVLYCTVLYCNLFLLGTPQRHCVQEPSVILYCTLGPSSARLCILLRSCSVLVVGFTL